MLIPIRCYTCGNVTGAATLRFLQAKTTGDQALALQEAGDRTCCRRMLLGVVHNEPLALSYESASSHMSSAACEVPRPANSEERVLFAR